jgi:hypothetical protein
MQTSNTPAPKPPPPHERKAILRVHVLMAEHDIRFVTELWKRLTAMGVEISHSQLTRVVNNSTKSLSIDLLEGLATLFDCPVSRLFKDN